jgi:predicted ATPase/DNA-binding SARP family transcriptional activator
LLGSFSASADGRSLGGFRTRMAQALFIYLSCQPERHRRESLMALLWPELPPASAQQNLRQNLYLLRQSIPDVNSLDDGLVPLILADHSTLQLNPAAAVEVDVQRFTALLGRKQRTPDQLAEAVALYRGDFLADFYLPDSEPFEEWAAARREAFRRLALEALDSLTASALEEGGYGEALAYARRQLEIDNLRESAHRQLMLALAGSGQRSDALAQYETCRRLLVEELGVEPAPATVELYRQIKENQVIVSPPRTLSLLPSAVQESPVPSPSHNLPAQSTPLIGRETELAKLNQLLAQSEGRLITIVGVGGIGKTRLALAVAGQQATEPQNNHIFSDGVYFVPLAPLGEADHILPTLAQAIGFQLQANDPRPPEQQVLDYLRRKRMLLLFDNFEHVLEGAGLLVDILQAAPQIEILVTSREPLRLYEEQLFALKGLLFSEMRATEADAAVQLFLQRAQWMQPDFVLHEDDLPRLTTICHQTGGIPLALELAAAWADTLTLAEIAGELAQSLDLLQTKWRNVPDRHQSIRAAFELSWQRLSADEQQIFSRLSVFRGGFTRIAAWQVCAPQMSQLALQRILAALAGKSLLHTISSPERYDLHELLRQFAAEKLAQTPDRETVVCDRHSAYYCTFLCEHTENWHTTRQLETLAAVTREADNAQLALHWALKQNEWQRLASAIDGWGWFLDWRGRDADGESFFRAIVEQVEGLTTGETIVSPDCLRLWAKALTWQGGFTIPESTDMLSLFQQSLALLEELERSGQAIGSEKAFLHFVEGTTLAFHFSDFQAGQRALMQALTLYQELGDKWGISESLEYIGWIDHNTGHYASALGHIKAALPIQQEQGDRRALTDSLGMLGYIHSALGQLDEAERLQREALSLSQEIGHQRAIAIVKGGLAGILFSQGKFDEAHEVTSESLIICQDLGLLLQEDWVRRTLGQTLLHKGQYQQARQQAAHSLALGTENRAIRDQRLYCLFGELALVASSYVEAQEAFAESAKISREEGGGNFIGLALAGLGYTACRLNQLSHARQHLTEALASALTLKAFLPAVYVLPGVALFLAVAGAVERAVEVWALAKRHPFVANSKWFEDVAGRELEALSTSLPLASAEAARERSRALDLWETAEALLGELEIVKEAVSRMPDVRYPL